MKKLTKKEIAEGIQAIPIERILLGANSPKGIKLTKRQKEFAEQVVKTGNKTEAYRRAYTSNGKNTTASRNANTVAKNSKVQTYIIALETAKEVEEYLLPTQLRTMAIQKLSSMALNDELPPAQQLKALELVGKMSEVSLFSQKVEHIHSVDSNTLKAQLLTAITTAIGNSRTLHTKTKRTAHDLLREIQQDDEQNSFPSLEIPHLIPTPNENAEHDTPPTPTHPNPSLTMVSELHTIPHNQSPSQSEELSPLQMKRLQQVVDIKEEKSEKEGVGVQNPGWIEKKMSIETPPITNWVEKG